MCDITKILRERGLPKDLIEKIKQMRIDMYNEQRDTFKRASVFALSVRIHPYMYTGPNYTIDGLNRPSFARFVATIKHDMVSHGWENHRDYNIFVFNSIYTGLCMLYDIKYRDYIWALENPLKEGNPPLTEHIRQRHDHVFRETLIREQRTHDDAILREGRCVCCRVPFFTNDVTIDNGRPRPNKNIYHQACWNKLRGIVDTRR